MNVLESVGMDLERVAPFNPCFGCTSITCRGCSCMEEHPKTELFDCWAETREPAKPKKQRKEVVSKKNAKPKTPARRREFATLPKGIFGSVGEGIVLQADGNGMKNAGIHTGDWLVFDTKLPPKDGDIAFITVDGTPMCRRIFNEGKMKRIRREDGVTPDVVTENCVVYAVLIGMMRNIRNGA